MMSPIFVGFMASGGGYKSTVLGSNPIMYLRLGESSGINAIDETTNGNDGTYGTADPHWDDVVLALHFEGSDGSTTFTDEKSHTVNAYGDAHIEQDQKKFGSTSGAFDGTGDYIDSAASSDWDLSSGTYTIDFWLYLNSLPSSDWSTIIARHSGTLGWRLLVGTTGQLHLSTDTGVDNGFHISSAVTTGTWYHIAAVGDSGTSICFIDGVKQTGTPSHTLGNPSSLSIKIGSTDGSAWFLDGYVDDLRVTKGVARWTSSFTAPITAFQDDTPADAPTLGSTSLLSGDSDTSILLDGVDNIVYLSDGLTDSEADFTVDCVIKTPTAAGSATTYTILSDFTTADGGFKLTLEENGSSQFAIGALTQCATTDANRVSNFGSLSAATIYHVAFTWDYSARLWNLYINGTVVSSFSTNVTGSGAVEQATVTAPVIGSLADAGDYFEGNIDDIAIYSSILSASVIQQHYEKALGV